MNNFDLRKFLIENKLTSISRELTQEEIDNSDWAMKARAQAHDARTSKTSSTSSWNKKVEARIEEFKKVHSDFKKDLDTHLNKIPSDVTKLQLLIDESAHRPEFETMSDKGTLSLSEIKKELQEIFDTYLGSELKELEALKDSPQAKAFQRADKILGDGFYHFDEMDWLEAIYDDDLKAKGMYPVLSLQLDYTTEIDVIADKPLPGFKS